MLILDRKPHSIEDLDWILEEAKRNGTHKDNHKRQFYNIVCAFDIETTSFNDDIPEEYTAAVISFLKTNLDGFDS